MSNFGPFATHHGSPLPSALLQFIHTSYPVRVVFGAGALAHLEREIDALGGSGFSPTRTMDRTTWAGSSSG